MVYFTHGKNSLMLLLLLQESTSGVYARLWERIKSNKEESLCHGDYTYCTKVWSNKRHLVKIGKCRAM